uniref:EGF-like domain-containing protein n=1 Tax=Plectus sambesii TaxID=2011161 RepID=A0A914VL57_9BILA
MPTATYTFFVALVIMVPLVWSRPQDIRLHIGHSPQDDPLNFDAPCEVGSCSGHGSCKELSRSPVRSKCACDDGFEGRHCQRRETMMSHRCYLRPGNSHEKNQIYGIKGCVDGQMCVPDNFYCFLYACPNSIGWCVKAHGAQAPTTHRTPTSDPPMRANQTFGPEDMYNGAQVPTTHRTPTSDPPMRANQTFGPEDMYNGAQAPTSDPPMRAYQTFGPEDMYKIEKANVS